MKSIIRVLFLLFAIFVPTFAFAAVPISVGVSIGIGTGLCTSNICYVASTIIYIINNVLVPLIFAIAFIVFLYGIARAYIFSGGDAAKVSEGHRLLLWGLIAFVVMVSLWGLVNVVANTFGLQGAYAPPTPSSISPYGSVSGGIFGQQPTYVQCPKDASGNCL